MRKRLKKMIKTDWFSPKKENPHLPYLAKIEEISQETGTIKTFTVRFLERKVRENFVFIPGQFIQVSVFGVGEAPVSFSCSPIGKKHFEFSVRNVGSVTSALFELKKGNTIGIRGPFGNGYPIKRLMDKNVIMAAGGIGFPPLKSLIEYMLESRDDFGHIWLLYGAKDPSDIVFKKTLNKWGRLKNFDVLITVDKPDKKWKGNVGVVTSLFNKIKIRPDNVMGLTCGPSIMMKYVVQSFKKIGLKDYQIFLSMERLMQCGIGKCGHCNIGNKYVCKDGPVFSYEELRRLNEKW